MKKLIFSSALALTIIGAATFTFGFDTAGIPVQHGKENVVELAGIPVQHGPQYTTLGIPVQH
ncbi:hypothetical protein SM124_09005 [Bacillus sp. 31A1R]|uniref:Uncharacterized protein n=1 Tax=Robertmurraya mangrovi TaxID=3098077 RepID=A0ABU5IXP5_9BACI|nr:hypothetical protein [Bacillus sp. 31A1R]MDZ5471886.1 hypothetical protein [Bacillus sp. 31A1R]